MLLNTAVGVFPGWYRRRQFGGLLVLCDHRVLVETGDFQHAIDTNDAGVKRNRGRVMQLVAREGVGPAACRENLLSLVVPNTRVICLMLLLGRELVKIGAL